MITPLKSSIQERLSALYCESAKFRIATDKYYTILWQSRIPDDCRVTFYDIGTKTPKDGMICRVFVGNMNMSAECETVNIDGEKLFMWTIHSAAELSAQINCISSYKDITFLFNTLKANVEDIKRWIANTPMRIPGRVKRLNSCDAMAEQIFILERICAVMYDRRQEAVDFYRLVLGTVNACNRFLAESGHYIVILTMQEHTLNELLISGEPFMLSSAIFCLIKRAVCISGQKLNMLFISHDENSISVSTKYISSEPYAYVNMTDEFELNSAKLYIELIGGKFELSRDGVGEQINITLPLYQQTDTFKSTKLCLSRAEFDFVARIILGSILF